MGLARCDSGPTTATAPDPCHVFTSANARSILGQSVTCSILVSSTNDSSFTAGYSAWQAGQGSKNEPFEVGIEVEGGGVVSPSDAQQQLAGQPGATLVPVGGQPTYWVKTASGWELGASEHGYLVSVNVPNATDQSQAMAAMKVILARL
jgi:hypothetical protein